ncbi:hypothetical protein L209DRAFT_759632 [Thermothelomyces heterothallicus CBS 203.75]
MEYTPVLHSSSVSQCTPHTTIVIALTKAFLGCSPGPVWVLARSRGTQIYYGS